MSKPKTEFSPVANKKIEQLINKGGEVMRIAKIVRMPDNSECSVDTFARCDWVTKHTGVANDQAPVWFTAEVAPKTGEQILADIGMPWPVVACWNQEDSAWVYPNLQVNMVKGAYSDPYFENENAHNHELKGWMPMPAINPFQKLAESE